MGDALIVHRLFYYFLQWHMQLQRKEHRSVAMRCVFDSWMTYKKRSPERTSLGRGDATRTRNRRFWRPLLYH